jgi:hypothetical protein
LDPGFQSSAATAYANCLSGSGRTRNAQQRHSCPLQALFADHAAELWPQISFDVRKSIALFIDHFSLSNMRPLIDQRFQCSACDLMFVSLWPFVTRDKADAWATNTALVNR